MQSLLEQYRRNVAREPEAFAWPLLVSNLEKSLKSLGADTSTP
jgi:hypothetical protein